VRSKTCDVNRSLAFVGAVALTLLRPPAALGAPTGGAVFAPVWAPVSRPMPARPATEERAGTPDSFKIRSDLDVRPRPLPEALRPALETPAEFGAQASFNPYRWRAWESTPGYLWSVPPWDQSACYSNGAPLAPSTWLTTPIEPPSPSADFTIGSLAGNGSQGLFTSPDSYPASLGGSYVGGAPAPGALTLQYGLAASPCGAANFFGF